jgi:hypothetical protein
MEFLNLLFFEGKEREKLQILQFLYEARKA